MKTTQRGGYVLLGRIEQPPWDSTRRSFWYRGRKGVQKPFRVVRVRIVFSLALICHWIGSVQRHVVILQGEALTKEMETEQSVTGECVLLNRLLADLDNPDWRVRSAAARALRPHIGGLQTEVVVDALTALFASESDYTVRAIVLHSLSVLGKQLPARFLETALHDRAWSVREMAVMVLEQLGEDAPPGLLEQALQDEDAAVRLAVLHVLERYRATIPLALLFQRLYDENEAIREVAAHIIWTKGEIAQEELLLAAFKDESGLIAAVVDKIVVEVGERLPAERLLFRLIREASIFVEDGKTEQQYLSSTQTNVNQVDTEPLLPPRSSDQGATMNRPNSLTSQPIKHTFQHKRKFANDSSSQ